MTTYELFKFLFSELDKQWDLCKDSELGHFLSEMNPYLYEEEGSADPTLEPYAWYKNNSDNRTHEVGLKRPNRLGLYDMNGNVGEACYNDSCWGNYFVLKMKETNSEVIINPLGYSSSSSDYCRNAKGASWASIGYMLSIDGPYSSIVIAKDNDEIKVFTGLRLMRSLVE